MNFPLCVHTYVRAYWTHIYYGRCTYTLMYSPTCLVSTVKGTPKLDFLSEVRTYVLSVLVDIAYMNWGLSEVCMYMYICMYVYVRIY